MSGPRLDGFESLVTGIGSFRDPRNSYLFCPEPLLTPEQAEILYRFYDIAARICELPVDESLSEHWGYTFPESEETEAKIVDRLNELKAHEKINDAGVFGRVHGDCFLYLDVTGGGSVTNPLDPAKISRVNFLRKVERDRLSVHSYYSDPRNVLYGEPELYSISQRANDASLARVLVHESRFLKFYGARTSDRAREANGGWHDSILQRISKVLRDFGVTWDAAQLLLSNSAQPKYKLQGLFQAMLAPDGAQKIAERMASIDRARGPLNSVLLDAGDKDWEGEEFTYEVAPLTSLPELLDRFASRLAAAAGGIPVTKLFGISPAGMNATGESDAKNWYRLLAAFRQDRLQPEIERLTVLLLSELNQAETEFEIAWPALDRPSALEDAQLRKAVAETDAVYITNQVLTPEEVASSRFGGPEYSVETTIDLSVERESEFPEEEDPEIAADAQHERDKEMVKLEADLSPTPRGDGDREDEQARAPKGSPNGGQWTSRGVSGAQKIRASARATYLLTPNEHNRGEYKKARELVRRAKDRVRSRKEEASGLTNTRAAGDATSRKAELASGKTRAEISKSTRGLGHEQHLEGYKAQSAKAAELGTYTREGSDAIRQASVHKSAIVEHYGRHDVEAGRKFLAEEHGLAPSDAHLRTQAESHLEDVHTPGKDITEAKRARVTKAVTKDIVDDTSGFRDDLKDLYSVQHKDKAVVNAAVKQTIQETKDRLSSRVRKHVDAVADALQAQAS
jgi:phage-related protein (TIGR01555 family)